MPKPDHEVTRQLVISAPLERVHALLSEPSRLPELHPLIHRVDVGRREVVDGEHRVAIVVHERVPLVWWSVPSRYPGVYRWRDAQALHIRGSAPGGVVVEMDWALSRDGEGTAVRQETRVQAPWPLRSFVVRTVHAAHDRLVAGLAEAFAGAAA